MTVPLNTYTHSSLPYTIYSTSTIAPAGTVAEDPIGKIETTSTGRALMRLYKGDYRRYTDDPAERAALEANGWIANVRVGYTQPPGTVGTGPTYRLTNAGGNQILILDAAERDRRIAEGWTWDATLGNLTPLPPEKVCYPDTSHFNRAYDPASVVFDWETPGWNEAYRLYSAPCDDQHGIQWVTSPRRQGGWAGKFSLTGDGGDYTSLSGERAEIVLNQSQTRGYEGGEAWFGWSTFFGDDFNVNTANLGTTAAKGSVLFANIHQTNAATSIPSSCGAIYQAIVDVKTNPITIRSQLRGGRSVDGGCTPSTYSQVNLPFERNVWHDFVMHVRFSFYDKDATHEGGLFEFWHNGVKVQEVLGKATLMDDQYAYWKFGIYRPVEWTTPSVLYHDGFRRGNSYEEVAP